MRTFTSTVSLLLFFFASFSINVLANEAGNLYQQLYQEHQKTTAREDSHFTQIKKMLSSLKEVKTAPPLALAPFHFQDKESLESKHTVVTDDSLASQGFCATCHSSTPHKKSIKTRSFLNMHSKTLACQTCHLKVEQSLDYQWQNKQGLLTKKIDFNDKNQFLLVPVHQNTPVSLLAESDFAQNIINQWQKNNKKLTQSNRLSKQALLWQNIHQVLELPANNKTKGQAQPSLQHQCTDCHQQSRPKLNLFKLGASKQRQQDFEQNIIARFFSRYKMEDDKINLIELLK